MKKTSTTQTDTQIVIGYTLPRVVCPNCLYVWVARTEKPKRCPGCFKSLVPK